MKVSFEIEEVELIKVAINKRLNEIKSRPQEKLNLKQNLRLRGLLDKIYRPKIELSINEHSLLKGVVNEFIYNPMEGRINYFRSLSNLDILLLTGTEKKEIEYLDKIIALANKLVPRDKKKQLLRSVDKYISLQSINTDNYGII